MSTATETLEYRGWTFTHGACAVEGNQRSSQGAVGVKPAADGDQYVTVAMLARSFVHDTWTRVVDRVGSTSWSLCPHAAVEFAVALTDCADLSAVYAGPPLEDSVRVRSNVIRVDGSQQPADLCVDLEGEPGDYGVRFGSPGAGTPSALFLPDFALMLSDAIIETVGKVRDGKPATCCEHLA